MRVSGSLLYVRLKSGGFRTIEKWWVEHPALKDPTGAIGVVRCADHGGRVWVELDTTIGRLTLHEHYQWDGASLPYVLRWAMSRALLRASLPHDGGYQLGRGGHFPVELEDEWRERFDVVLRDVGVAQGMFRWWAASVFIAVRRFAAFAFARQPEVEDVELQA